MPIERSQVIQLMRSAFREGQSASSFINEMRAEGLAYRRQDMLADWRSVNELEKKEGALRYVRKDYYPTTKTLAEVEWKLSEEYMYKVKVQSRTEPGQPITERFVNIMSATPLTPGQVEEQVEEAWGSFEKYGAEEITDIVPWSAIQRVGL